jgi:putative glutamine amidotransferase
MDRPTIGITVDCTDDAERYESPFGYAKAVEMAGGLPLMLPYKSDLALIPQFLNLLDGVLFTGGNDLDPALYGQDWHPRAEKIDPDRQRFDLALMAEVERRRKPMLGICLGCQIMNVHRGGSLHQFLPDIAGEQPLEHRRVGPDLKRHPVALLPDSALGRAIGKTQLSVNTYHKQAVDRLGRNLRVVATAPDGTIEGFEDPSLPLFAAVQWHPERLTDEPEHLAPFRLLIERATRP